MFPTQKIKRLFIFDFVKLMFKNLKDIFFCFELIFEINLIHFVRHIMKH
jgi:hypothetical protein